MKLIDITNGAPSLDDLEQSAQEEEILLVRNGHVILRIGAFDDEDWEDWQAAYSPEAIEAGRRLRAEVAEGKVVSLDELKAKLGL